MDVLIDRWSLVHLAVWFSIGAGFRLFHIETAWVQWTIVIVGALSWEGVELLLEHLRVFSNTEPPLNRWVSDVAIAILGAGIGLWWVR